MRRNAYRTCNEPGCGAGATYLGKCDRHNREAERKRGTRTQRGYDNAWLNLRNRKRQQHVNNFGLTCPGWNRDPHPVQRIEDLTGDHIVPLSQGGTSNEHNVAILCHSCNSTKRASEAQRV